MTRLSRILFSAAVATNIAFSRPIRFAGAHESTAVRSVLPTTLTSADFETFLDITEGTGAEILERARFSAQTTSVEYLDEWDQLLGQYLDGDLDQATFRLRAKEKLDAIGYVPKPGEKGTITDLSSDLRINLRIEMDALFARGYGTWKHDQAPVILDAFPAQELFRAASAKEPRDWIARWQEAGGQLFESDGGQPRMIALRNDPIWTSISRFGLPYPPFDYGSHMRTRLVARKKAMSLGLIDRDTQIAPQDRNFNDDLQYSAVIRSKALRQALLEADPRLEFRTAPGGQEVLTFKKGVF